jgi:hypothetical protein
LPLAFWQLPWLRLSDRSQGRILSVELSSYKSHEIWFSLNI